MEGIAMTKNNFGRKLQALKAEKNRRVQKQRNRKLSHKNENT